VLKGRTPGCGSAPKNPTALAVRSVKVQIDEAVSGDFENEVIHVYVLDDDLLEVGKQYIFFLSEASYTEYPIDFFVQFPEFILKVENNHVLRLVDSFRKEYIEPFVDKKYNQVDELIKYMKQHRKEQVRTKSEKAIDKMSCVDELLSYADHVIEIKAGGVIPVDNNLAIVNYEILKKYKGGDFHNNYSLLLPDVIQEGDTYLLFLKDTGERSGESVTLATRQGSIINRESAEYDEYLKYLLTFD
jgi:hypothetical protein